MFIFHCVSEVGHLKRVSTGTQKSKRVLPEPELDKIPESLGSRVTSTWFFACNVICKCAITCGYLFISFYLTGTYMNLVVKRMFKVVTNIDSHKAHITLKK